MCIEMSWRETVATGPLAHRSRTCIMEDNDPVDETAVATLEFERELESLLLNAFARGASVEGAWTITASVETVPEWTVEIVKSAGADTDYDPEFIE